MTFYKSNVHRKTSNDWILRTFGQRKKAPTKQQRAVLLNSSSLRICVRNVNHYFIEFLLQYNIFQNCTICYHIYVICKTTVSPKCAAIPNFRMRFADTIIHLNLFKLSRKKKITVLRRIHILICHAPCFEKTEAYPAIEYHSSSLNVCNSRTTS